MGLLGAYGMATELGIAHAVLVVIVSPLTVGGAERFGGNAAVIDAAILDERNMPEPTGFALPPVNTTGGVLAAAIISLAVIERRRIKSLARSFI